MPTPKLAKLAGLFTVVAGPLFIIQAAPGSAGWLFGSSVPKCGDSDVMSELETQFTNGYLSRLPPSQLDFFNTRGNLSVEFSFGNKREREPYNEEIRKRFCEPEIQWTIRLKGIDDNGSEEAQAVAMFFAGHVIRLNETENGLVIYDIAQNEDGSVSVMPQNF